MELPDSLPPPGWVDSGAVPSGGLDLLGLRLPVQTIGNSLLTGITTVTSTIRYLSVHAWLVHSYARAKRLDRWSDFRSFAAVAEAAVVLGNLIRDPGTPGLIGRLKGAELLGSEDSRIPLGALVQQLGVTIYANPAFQLGLAHYRDSGVPGLSKERGLPLARSVRSLVRGTALGDLISAGKNPTDAAREQLEELGQRLGIHDIPEEEKALLLAALLPQAPKPFDIPRMETYALLLHLAQELGQAPGEQDLFAASRAAGISVPDELQGVLDGWLRYSARDLLSTVGESAVQVAVDTLNRLSEDGARAVSSRRVWGELLGAEEEHGEALREIGLASSGESVWSLKFADLHHRVTSETLHAKASSGGLDRWTGSLDERSVMDSSLRLGPGRLAMLPVAWCLATVRAAPWNAAEHGPFEDRNDLGWTRLGLDEVARPTVEKFLREETGLREATGELAQRMIDQHLRVAWSRMATDMKKDVSVLATDGETWHSRKKTLHAGRTGSRLAQAIGWLEQLGLIDEAGATEAGIEVLDRTLLALKEGRP